MKAFMDKDFLLDTETAKKLYHEHAEKMPIIDYHCHLQPKEIYEDKKFRNLAEVWLGAGDRYGDVRCARGAMKKILYRVPTTTIKSICSLPNQCPIS